MPERVALVVDRVDGSQPWEPLLEVCLELYPRAELRALTYQPGKVQPALTVPRRLTSRLVQLRGLRGLTGLPCVRRWAMRRLSLEAFDLVISAGTGLSAEVRVPAGARHVKLLATEAPPAAVGTFLPQARAPFTQPERPGSFWLTAVRPARRQEPGLASRLDELAAAAKDAGQAVRVVGLSSGWRNRWAPLEPLGELSPRAFADVLSKSRGWIQLEDDPWGQRALTAWSAGVPCVLRAGGHPFGALRPELGAEWAPGALGLFAPEPVDASARKDRREFAGSAAFAAAGFKARLADWLTGE